MRIKIATIFFILIFVAQPAEASENEFITIVNPVRIAPYTQNVDKNILVQSEIISAYNIPATWLITYDVIKNSLAVSSLKKIGIKNEVGVFLEVTPNLASAANIEYIESGSWHHANSIFLSGYTQFQRIKLIDVIFESYFEVFSAYPKSVGGWWIDSFSLDYMHKKYGITSNLVCADQQDTDGYTIRGLYWSAPFYPSRFHAGIPAQNVKNKIGVVTIQWAPRDPNQGFEDSKYSTQDYFTTPQKNIEYFKYLLNIYGKKHQNTLGQVTIGLEGDFNPELYHGEYAKQIEAAFNFSKEENVKFLTMSEFANKYVSLFPQTSPIQETSSEDGFAKWYSSPNYRVGYRKNNNSELEIIDLRLYQSFKEPYYGEINGDKQLEIYVPSLIDTLRNSEEIWILPTGATLATNNDSIEINSQSPLHIPKMISNSPYINVQVYNDTTRLIFKTSKEVSTNDKVITGWSSEAQHFFSQTKFPVLLIKDNKWKLLNKQKYLVTQEELQALEFLKLQPAGDVIVPDSECLQCNWSTLFQPAVLGNQRKYVSDLTGKRVIKNNKIFLSDSREESKKEFKKFQAKYIYLVQIGNYHEKLPFSPGDLGVKKIFENANAQIWKTE